MAAYIELSDGTPAHCDGDVWSSPDPGLAEALQYFTRKLPHRYRPYPAASIAEEVVSMIVGARVVHVDPITTVDPPGMKY